VRGSLLYGFLIVSWATINGNGLAQVRESQKWEAEIEPFSSLPSPVFELEAGQGLRLSALSTDLDLDGFVYDADSKELVDKSDDEKVEQYYEWRAFKRGKYYMVVRNISAHGGSSEVDVLPRGTAKSLGDIRAPNTVVMDVYYATDRAVIGQSAKGTSYGTEPLGEDRLEYGIARVTIPQAHAMGELEGPSILRLEFSEDPEKHVVLKSTTPESPDSFYMKVSDRVLKSPRREALVFVHGFNVTFEDAARRTAQISYDLGFAGAAILYSWPSQGKLGLVEYNKDGRNAELSVPHFKAFLSQFSARTGVRTIHVIAHSMGNRVVMKALADGSVSRSGGPIRIREVALMAPDIDAAEFRRLAVAMQGSAHRVTLYASSKDAAMQASERLSGYPRAGEGGDQIVIMPGVIETIDSSTVDTSLLGLMHQYYADNSTILADLFHLIRGEDAHERFRLKPVNNVHGQYWVFAPAVR